MGIIIRAMDQVITNTLTVTFEDGAGVSHSEKTTAIISIAEDPVPEPTVYLENIVSNHK